MSSEKLRVEEMVERIKKRKKNGWSLHTIIFTESFPNGDIYPKDLLWEYINELISYLREGQISFIHFKKHDKSEKYRKEKYNVFVRIVEE